MQAKLPPFVLQILNKFQENGFEIYLVGGAVRDLLMNREVKDWDLTTNATPDQIMGIYPDAFYNNKFGTVCLPDKSTDNPEIYEVTTFRREIGYSDKRHPDKVVWGKTLEEDLARRDFTINSMALGLSQEGKNSLAFSPSLSYSFEIIDPFDGQKDLEAKLVRAVGDPNKRFSEDALRMMRAIRIATQIRFSIEEETFEAIKNNATLINQIAGERIRDELFKILETDFPADGINLLLSTGLLERIIPELIKGYGLKQARHHIYDVYTHSVMSLKFCPSDDSLVRLATLLHDIGKPVVVKGEGEKRTFYNHEVLGASIVGNIADRLRLSKKEKDRLVTLVRMHQFSVDERQTDSAIRRFIRNVGKENLEDILAVRTGDRLGGGARETSWRLEKYKKRIEEVQKQPFSLTDIKVNGKDVMKVLNTTPGPIVGKILNQLFEEVVEGKIKNQRSLLLKRIEQISLEISLQK